MFQDLGLRFLPEAIAAVDEEVLDSIDLPHQHCVLIVDPHWETVEDGSVDPVHEDLEALVAGDEHAATVEGHGQHAGVVLLRIPVDAGDLGVIAQAPAEILDLAALPFAFGVASDESGFHQGLCSFLGVIDEDAVTGFYPASSANGETKERTGNTSANYLKLSSIGIDSPNSPNHRSVRIGDLFGLAPCAQSAHDGI